jgi:uncharacterized Zn finger protein
MAWSSYHNRRRYVRVAERRFRASRLASEMKEFGRELSPIEIASRKIAHSFWGAAWCDNLEAYSDYANRLPRGRTYVRNGSVIDLQIESGCVRALVSGSDIYEVEVEIERLPAKRWAAIRRECAGRIGSLVELLRGSISNGVMEVVTRKKDGLFPAPGEISLSCSCPDWATVCKHVAATLYGVGARLDDEPELLFVLRGVAADERVEAAVDESASRRKPRNGRRLAASELSSVFGIEIDTGEATAEPRTGASGRRKRTTGAKKKKKSGKKKTGKRSTRVKKTASRKPTAAKPSAKRRSAARKPATKKKRSPKDLTKRG